MDRHLGLGDALIISQGFETIILLGPRAAARLHGLHRESDALRRRLRPSDARLRRLLHQDHAAQARLRRTWDHLGLPLHGATFPEHLLLDAVAKAVANGRLLALYLPQPTRGILVVVDREALDRRLAAVDPTWRQAEARLGPVSGWSKTNKVEQMLDRVPRYAGGDALKALKSLFSDEGLAVLAGSLVVLGAAQAIGIGEIADAGLAAYVRWTAGRAGLVALADLLTAIVLAAQAQSEPEIDHAAALFAGALVVVGVSGLTLFMTRAGRKPSTVKSDAGAVANVERQAVARRGIARTTAKPEAEANQAATERDFEDQAISNHPYDKKMAAEQKLNSPNSPEIRPEDLVNKTRSEIEQYANKKGLIKHPTKPNKYLDPVTKKERLRIDPGHVDPETGKPYNNPNAAVPHVHGYPKEGPKGGKVRNPTTNDPHFPLK